MGYLRKTAGSSQTGVIRSLVFAQSFEGLAFPRASWSLVSRVSWWGRVVVRGKRGKMRQNETAGVDPTKGVQRIGIK